MRYLCIECGQISNIIGDAYFSFIYRLHEVSYHHCQETQRTK